MTNCFHAKAEWIEGAWRAMVRYSHRSDYWPVMDGDKPAGFPTKGEAELAALRAQEKHINGTITGFGDKATARSEAEKLFMGGGRTVEVGKKPFRETRGRARAI